MCKMIPYLYQYGDSMAYKDFPHYWTICVGNPPVAREFPLQRTFDVFFVVSLNELSNKQSIDLERHGVHVTSL